MQKLLSTTPILPWVHRTLSVLVSEPAAASSTESSSLWQKSAGCTPWTAPSAPSSHASAKLASIAPSAISYRRLPDSRIYTVPANHLYIYFLDNRQSGRKIILFSQSVSKKEMPPKHEAASWPRKNPNARVKGEYRRLRGKIFHKWKIENNINHLVAARAVPQSLQLFLRGIMGVSDRSSQWEIPANAWENTP
ncbi:hypothetical protein B0H10DRAFT_1954550 [Mycena sp. CBHHK59/15]|nr:hypothetical protein B0H10DRAFT_1954550 [Mycena sp. CBHHK59/15]